MANADDQSRSPAPAMLVTACRVMVWVGGAAVLADAFLIVIDIGLRAVAGSSIPGTTEIGGFILAVSSAWAFAFALLHKAHVRIDSLYLRLPRRARLWLDIAALGALSLFMFALAFRAAQLVALSFEFGSRSMSQLQAPLWIPQGLWLFGIAGFTLLCAVMLLRVIAGALGNRPDLASAIAMESVDAELAGELRDARRRASEVD